MNVISKTKYPIAVEWPLSEDCLKELKDKSGKHIKSGSFVACESPDIKYYIGIRSYEPGHERHGGIWTFLFLNIPKNMQIEANYTVTIESANYLQEENHIYNSSIGWGRCFCKTDELLDHEMNFIVNGQMTIKMDGTLVIEKEEETNEPWKCGKNGDPLGIELWEQEGHKNFIVEVDGKEIAVDKCILSARSPVFAKMFESGMKEVQENKVIIEDFTFDIVEKALKLLYHHSLVTYSSMDDKIKLLQFFDKYNIESLKSDLETYLIGVINELTVCRLTNSALLSNVPKLQNQCTKFLHSCLRKPKPIADFDILDKDFAMNLLKSSFCHVSE